MKELPLIKNDDPLWNYPCWYAESPRIVKAMRLTEKVQVETNQGTITANPGDRIVMNPKNKQMYIVNAEFFSKNYYGVAENKEDNG